MKRLLLDRMLPHAGLEVFSGFGAALQPLPGQASP
jgi:hypothetical protein